MPSYPCCLCSLTDQLELVSFYKQLGLSLKQMKIEQKSFQRFSASENDHSVTLHPITKAFRSLCILLYHQLRRSFSHAGHCRRSLFRLGIWLYLSLSIRNGLIPQRSFLAEWVLTSIDELIVSRKRSEKTWQNLLTFSEPKKMLCSLFDIGLFF